MKIAELFGLGVKYVEIESCPRFLLDDLWGLLKKFGIKGYEEEIANLKKANEKQRVESALDRVLLEANVQDVDYVKFKIKEKGTELKLDEQGNLTGVKDMLDALKVQLPNQFSNSTQNVKEFKLPQNENPNDKGITKEEFNKMSYQERLKLFNENKEVFNELTKSNE